MDVSIIHHGKCEPETALGLAIQHDDNILTPDITITTHPWVRSSAWVAAISEPLTTADMLPPPEWDIGEEREQDN